MALARWQATIQDLAGNAQAAASVEVRDEGTGALVELKADRDGLTPKANPFLADANGFAFFHSTAGSYKITATKDALTVEHRYVAVGTGAESDIAAGVTREINDAGTVVVGPGDSVILMNKDVGEPTDVELGPAADRNGVDIIIKDIKLDAAANNITPVFDGVEDADGLTGAQLAIKSNGGLLHLKPKPDGTGYTVMASQL